MNKETISVGMCTYNGQRFLFEQLDSIARQTRPPDELVVCDDNSTDETVDILKAFAESSALSVRIYRNKDRLGTTKNFEQAIALAQGTIIMLSDQDDVWHPDRVKVIEAAFRESSHIGAVFTDAEVVDDHLESLGYSLWQFMKFNAHGHVTRKRAMRLMLKRNPSYGSTMAFRSDQRELILPIPVRVPHDMWTGLIIAATAELAFIKKPLVRYRLHADQNSVDRPTRFGFRERLRRAREEGRIAIRDNLILYEEASKRVANFGLDPKSERAIRLIESKISHMRTRANIPTAKLRRVPTVIREFLTLRYHHYSNGSLSAARDLFL